MSNRKRLAQRRAHEVIAIEHGGQRYKIGLGRELICVERGQLGPVAEVFVNAQQVDSTADAISSHSAWVSISGSTRTPRCSILKSSLVSLVSVS